MLYLCIVIKPSRNITKFDLCKIFGLVSPTGFMNSRVLSKDYFTDKVISDLGITREEYKKIRIFNYEQSLKIIEIMHIDRHDLAFAGIDRVNVPAGE